MGARFRRRAEANFPRDSPEKPFYEFRSGRPKKIRVHSVHACSYVAYLTSEANGPRMNTMNGMNTLKVVFFSPAFLRRRICNSSAHVIVSIDNGCSRSIRGVFVPALCLLIRTGAT